MPTSLLAEQKEERRKALVLAYQTLHIFRTRRLERRGLKINTFLGIVVPLIAGGLFQILYSSRADWASNKWLIDWLIDGSSLLLLSLTALSVWALVDKWEEEVQRIGELVQKYGSLVNRLELLRAESDGLYDARELRGLMEETSKGRIDDDLRGVSERRKRCALAVAEAKYPPVRKQM